MQINDRLEWLYKLRGKQIKLGLEPTAKFLKSIDLKKIPYPIIHIAGTNGKGSTAYFICRLLMAHGIKTGLYTSPHIELFNERIRIDEILIPDQFIEDFLNKNEEFIIKTEITFFETTTTMAFAYFAQKEVDIAVIETGLGGRFDSTNVVDPELIAITRVAMDHEDFLGNSLKSIAGEKLGIVKKGKKVFATIQEEELVLFFENQIRKLDALLYWTKAENVQVTPDGTEFTWQEEEFKLAMLGSHQAGNAALALDVVSEYLSDDFSINKSRDILAQIIWPARIEVVSRSPLIIFDSAHNAAGFEILLETLDKAFQSYKWIGIMGIMADKGIDTILPSLKRHFRKIWCKSFKYHRALSAVELSEKLKNNDIESDILISGDLEKIINSLHSGEGLIIFGTHYIMAEIRNELDFKK